MLVLAVGLLFMLLFVHALTAFLRGRDPLAGDVTLLFSSMSGLFVLTVLRILMGEPSRVLESVAVAMLLAQPVLTLRLVSRFRDLPRVLMPGAVLLYVLSTPPVAILENPPRWTVWAAVAVFAVVGSVAAGYFVAEAGRRTGSPWLRLQTAAVSTVLFAVALVAAGLNLDLVSRLVALLSACGYVAAFMPPARLRRMSAMAAAHKYGRVILAGPSQPTADEVWRRFAEAVYQFSESDAIVVFARRRDGAASIIATAGLEQGAVAVTEPDDFERMNLLSRQHPVDPAYPLEMSLAARVGARFATLVPLTPPYTQTARHVTLLLSRHRSLFSDDDLEVIRDLGGQTALLAGHAETATEERRMAEELADTVDALNVASEAKSQLLARVSHEFRTPLTAIIGYSALLRRGVNGDDSKLAHTGPDRIHSAGLHLLTLVEEVLDVAKMDAGHLELELEPVDLQDLVSRTLDELRPLASRKQLVVRSEASPGSVSADPHRLRQVLYNLLANAIKFTPDGGTVRVVTELSVDEARISVIDTGIGIPAADQTRVFEEFTQVKEHAPHNGSGLGLAIARRLVAAHGGHTELESAPGEGSTFTVCLPRRSEDSVALEPRESGPRESAAEPGSGVGEQ